MPLPATGPASRSAVKALLGVADADVSQDELVDRYVAVANNIVTELPIAQRANTDPAPADWSAPEFARIVEGANMLGARLYVRKDSAEGVAATAVAAAVYVQRNDPDIAQMLLIGAYQKPAVG
jgi:hypothetical protein